MLDPAQQEFQKRQQSLLAARPAGFAPLIDLMPQISQLALQVRDSAGLPSLTPFAQFPLEILELLAQPVQSLPKLSVGNILLPVVIVFGPAAAGILDLIPDPAQLCAQPFDLFP